jgi:hypothetical protein
MYAVFIEVDADESDIDVAREILPKFAAPNARERGATGGYWLAPFGGRGVSVVVFDTEEQALGAASQFTVGEPPMANAPGNVKVRTVEVREVLASV